MSIGEYYKMLVDGKRPTRQRTHDPPKATSSQPKASNQTLKLKKPDKKEEHKEKTHPPHPPHKDPDEKKRDEKLMHKIKTKENQKDIKTLKELSKTDQVEKINAKSEPVSKEKPKPKAEPPHVSSEQPKLRHHPAATLAPKKEQEQRQKIHQTQQVQQADDSDLYESIFPHPKYVEDRLCDYIDAEGTHSIGKILSFEEDSQQFTIQDYSQPLRKVQVKVDISDNQVPQIEVLAKSYLCKLSTFPPSTNLPFFTALNHYFNTTQPNQKFSISKFLFPIVQTLKPSTKGVDPLNKGNNNLQFKALVPLKVNKENDDEEMKDEEAKGEDNGSRFQLIDLTFKDGFNPLKDLKLYDSDQFHCDSNREVLNSLFQLKDSPQDPFFSSLDSLSLSLSNASKEYLNKSSNIIITKENMNDMLFSLCKFETLNKEQQVELDQTNDKSKYGRQKQGILLRIKYDPHYQDYLLMFRITLSKQFQKERIEWIQLSKHRIRSDLSKGYISIDFLQNFENISTTNQKIKVKNIHFVSYFESQLSKQDLKDPSFEDHIPQNQLSENKAASSKTIKARGECCNYTTEDIASLQCSNCHKVYHEQCLQSEHLTLLSVREKQWRCSECIRCTNCLSIKNRNLMMICTKCNSPFHYDCLDQSVKLSVPFIGVPEKEQLQIAPQTSLQAPLNATSSQAVPSSLALAQTKSVSPTKVSAPLMENHYKCENCIFCEHCGVREAGKNRLNKWSKDFKLCSKCNKKKKNKQYCAICEMFWPNQEKEQRRENWNLNQTKHSEDAKETGVDKPCQFDSMTFCSHCQMWIHNKCDRMLQNDTIRDKFKTNPNDPQGSFTQKANPLEYNCPDCRQEKRTQLIVQLVDNICAEDRYQFFQEPVEDRIKGYTKIVKLPMCFKYVKSQIHKLYLRNPEQLQQDIALIFSNAKLFNLPKHKVHKDAIKLDSVSQQLIQSIWPTLQKYKLRTLDEDLHRAQIRLVIEQQKERRGLGMEETKDEIEIDEDKFNYKPNDLFDLNEHQSISNSRLVYQNSAIGALGQIELGNEEHKDVSEHVGEEENDDTFFGQRAQVKGLRIRKPFDYNEDRLLNDNSDLSVLGKRSLKPQRSSYIPQGDDESTFSLPQGIIQVGRPSKRHKGNQQDPDFIPAQYQSSILSQRSDLLQQAIQQQQKQQQQNQLEPSSLALTGQDSFIISKQMESSQNQHIQQQQQMMMNYYQEIDDEKCYYSNPSRCSFDDPSLLFEEMCYLCGSFGNREDFLSCTLCGESFHTYCLSLPHDDISKFQSYWKCLNCKFCEICSSAVQENLLLYCDVCDKAFHSYCLKPKLEVIPNCGWKCQECFSCVKCHAKSFFNAQDVEQQKNKEVKDFKFSNNFSFCYQCGTNEYKKSFCSICKEKDESMQDNELTSKITTKRQKVQQQQQLLASEANSVRLNRVKSNNRDQMMKCSVCQFYSHLRCSRVTQETIDELDSESLEEKKNSYRCLNCLLSGKTINHLIRESCEHYENIHQIISRQKLLAQICAEVLNKYIPIQEKAPLFIKNFVDQNQDFFKTNPTINDWLQLLETNVCFESEDSQYEQTKDQSQPINTGEDNEEEKVSQETIKQRKEALWRKISESGIIDFDQEVSLYEKGELNSDKVETLLKSLKEIKDAEQGQEREDLMEIDKVEGDTSEVNWYHEHKAMILHDQAIFQAAQAKLVEKPPRVKQIVYKKWVDVKFDDLLPQQLQEEVKDSDQVMSKEVKTQKDLVEHELYAHKQTFLPPKRNLYKSLFYGDLYRQTQRDHFANPFDLKSMITVPTEQNLQLHASIQSRAEDYVKLEFKAVMQIRMQFFKWSEDLIKSIVKKNMKFLKRERKQGSKSGKENNSVKNDESHMSIDNVDPVDASTNKSQVDGVSTKVEQYNSKVDEQIKNPQLKLTCTLCKLSGELRVTGRLIPYQINQFVHINCALWSTDVFETEDGQLVNFYFVHTQRAKTSKCQICGEYGATIYCFSRKCHNSYHFPCAFRQNKVAFLKNKETYCAMCCQQKELQTGYLEEYSTQRRLYIVKNIQPYLTNAFSNIFPGTQTGAQQLQGGLNGVVGVFGAQEGDKPFQIEKWRPFYYDMFNRVGNLTVLSLKKEINQIIEDIKSSFGPTSSSLMIENSQLNDFATIRIYWKFYKDQQMQIEDPNAVNPIKLPKGFYLYSNNQVREIAKCEFYSVLSHVSERVKDKVQWAINMSSGVYQGDEQGKSNEGQGGLHGGTGVIHSQTNFWTKILTHFQKERPNFSLQNIEFSIQEFAGKTKYPISIWNRAEVKNKNFFLKSGLQQLAALCSENKDSLFSTTQTNKASRQGSLTQDDIFKNMLKINQVGGVDNQSLLGGGNQYKRYICSKHMKYDQLLQQLGKKVLFFKAAPEEQVVKQTKEKDQLQKRLNKKLRITDTIDVNKQIDLPIAMKYRMCKAQPKRVEVGPSKIHRNGLFTLEDLMAGDIVIEYVGEKIRNKVADKREVVYEQKGIGDCYLFRLDKETIIDATFNGNKARYLNHCCDANCSAKIINVQGLKHIIISANRAIKSGEELTYNYNFDIEAEKLECYCGVANCVGRLN